MNILYIDQNKKNVSRLNKLKRSLPALLISLLMTGCVRNEAPAPVVSLNDSKQSSNVYQENTSGSVGIVPLQPESSMNVNNNQSSYNNQPIQMSQPTSYNSAPVVGSQIPQRDYNAIPKGTFTGTTYTVQPGDTLFYVAWITGSNVNDLANLNGLSYPYPLNAGQQLTISNQVNPTTYNSQEAYASSSTFYNSQETSNANNVGGGKMLSSTANYPASTVSSPIISSGSLSQVSSKGFRWPTEGSVILGFSNADGGSKGIEIAGNQGQAVFASKGGKVVYAGNALAGYGNLIIINHDEEYLSAYAHNDTILVSEGESIEGGQQIATMGSTGTDRVKLYFEIRHKGVSIDPIPFLPKK